MSRDTQKAEKDRLIIFDIDKTLSKAHLAGWGFETYTEEDFSKDRVHIFNFIRKHKDRCHFAIATNKSVELYKIIVKPFLQAFFQPLIVDFGGDWYEQYFSKNIIQFDQNKEDDKNNGIEALKVRYLGEGASNDCVCLMDDATYCLGPAYRAGYSVIPAGDKIGLHEEQLTTAVDSFVEDPKKYRESLEGQQYLQVPPTPEVFLFSPGSHAQQSSVAVNQFSSSPSSNVRHSKKIAPIGASTLVMKRAAKRIEEQNNTVTVVPANAGSSAVNRGIFAPKDETGHQEPANKKKRSASLDFISGVSQETMLRGLRFLELDKVNYFLELLGAIR